MMQASARSSGHNGSGHAGMAVCVGFIALVDEWISRAANGNAVSWFRETIERIRHESGGDKLAMAIGLAPRRLGKADLPLTPDDKARAMAVAKEVGADMAKLEKDLASPEVKATLEENMKLAEAMGMNGTPSYVIGKQVVIGAVGVESLREKIGNARCGKATC